MRKFQIFFLILNSLLLLLVSWLVYIDCLMVESYEPPFDYLRLTLGVMVFGFPFWLGASIVTYFLIRKKIKKLSNESIINY